jgi:nucleoside-diphosphate-sugar epimerase
VRYVIIGCGNIGLELARRWVAAGHEVLGTTTRPERVPELKEICTDTAVLRGNDTERVRTAVTGADAVVVAVSPKLGNVLARRERVIEFRDSLVGTARTVASMHRRVVLLSATVVYGDGGEGDAPVDEHTQPTIDLEPSAQGFAAAERVVLEYPGGAVLRMPLVYGQPGAMDPTELVRFIHEKLGGSLPIAADSLAYRVDYRDVAAAVEFVVAHGLTGIYNVVPDDTVPDSFEVAHGQITEALGLPPLTFLAEMKTPTRPITSEKLRAAGFAFSHSTPS